MSLADIVSTPISILHAPCLTSCPRKKVSEKTKLTGSANLMPSSDEKKNRQK